MRVTLWLAIAVLNSACSAPAATGRAASTSAATTTDVAIERSEQKTSTDPAVNPHAAALAEFKKRVEAYADLHQDLAKGDAKPQETADPAKIDATKNALATKVQSARATAKPGDIFTPEVQPVFRQLLAPELRGEDGHDTKAVLKDDAPAAGTVPFKVNAKFPENQPRPTVPSNLLLSLPPLPKPLEYRIVGRHLIILDTAADLVVDYMLNAIPA
jgi:hypothetical protein